MSEYTPDNWVVLKITEGEETIYKVLGGWRIGEYLYGDCWQMNSGITGVEKQAHLYGFYGSSGSVYWCPQGSYGLTTITSGIYDWIKENYSGSIELVPEDTNWMEIEW